VELASRQPALTSSPSTVKPPHSPAQACTRPSAKPVMSTRRIKASLLSLPDELLGAIFSEVVRDDDDVPAPGAAAALVSTCRRLAPIVRQEVYRELRVGGDATEAHLLSELCAKRPDLRALVQVLHLQRTVEFDDDGEMTYDYTEEHPGIALTNPHFPALHAVSILEAAPVDILRILRRVSRSTSPGIRKLTLECVPDPKSDVPSEHRQNWWHMLEYTPSLEDLTLFLISLDFMVRIVSGDVWVFSPLQNLHSLTIDGVPWDPVRGPTLAVLFPNLKRLRLHYGSSTELETLLRHAPTSLTQLTLWLIRDLTLVLQSNVLARFPLLERLCLRKIDGKVLLPSIRKSRIRYIRLSHKAEFTDEIMLDLVDGPARVKHLKAIQLDYVSLDGNRWGRLSSAFRRDQQYDLAQVKATLSPKWPQGCSADGLRAVMDAAGKNGIKVYGTAVDCLDWSDRFDEQVEHFLVDDALASNDYTTIERYLGEDGAGKAILRQRPRLAELIRKGMT
jgi:hypothetical protein